MKEEVLVPFDVAPERVRPATHVRSTLLCASLQSLRTRGFGDAYFQALVPSRRDEMLSLLPGHWVEVALGTDHYAACDALGLASEVIEEVGGEVAKRVHHSVLGIAVRLSREVGVTPWSVLGLVKRMRDLTWKGGDVAVYKLGPKEARFEWVGLPFAHIPYYRVAFLGFARAHLGLFCRKAYVFPIRALETESRMAFRFAWA